MKKLILAATVVALPTMAVQADEAAMFEQLDTDKSASISQEEAKAHPALVEMFAKLDANADGEIDAEEFKAGVKTDA